MASYFDFFQEPNPEELRSAASGPSMLSQVLSGVSDIYEGARAGYRGKPNPVIERRMKERQLQMQEQRLGMEQQNQQLDRSKFSMAVLNHMSDLAEKGIEPEQLEKYAQGYAEIMKNAGVPVPSSFMSGLLSSPDRLKEFKETYPDLTGRVSDRDWRMMFADKTGTVLDRKLKDVRGQLGQEAMNQVGAWIDTLKQSKADVTQLDEDFFRRALPTLRYADKKEVAQLLQLKGVRSGDIAMKQAEAAATAETPTKSDNDLAQGWFGKNFKDLTGGEKQTFSKLRNLPQGTQAELSTMGVDWTKPENQKGVANLIDKARTKESGRIQERGINIQLAGIENRPIDPTTAGRLTDLYAAREQLKNIKSNLDKNFLGPIKGTEAAFAVRRRVGNYIGSPLGERETVFRQSLADVKDMLLRARSGAQINEQEYKRLAAMLPSAADEPQVFNAGYKRFEDELNQIIRTKESLATTSRRQLRQGGQPTEREFDFVPGKGLVPVGQ